MIDILNHIYIEYTLAVIVITEVIKRALAEGNLQPKWITAAVAVVLGVVGVIIKIQVQHEAIDFWRMLTSFGVSIIGYDYLLKPILDRFNKK